MLLWEQGLLEAVEGVPEDRGHLETEGELGEEGVLQVGRGGDGLGLHHFRQDAPKVVLAILFAAAALEAGQADPHQSIGDLYMLLSNVTTAKTHSQYAVYLSLSSLLGLHFCPYSTPHHPSIPSHLLPLNLPPLLPPVLPPPLPLPHLGEENAQVPRPGVGS